MTVPPGIPGGESPRDPRPHRFDEFVRREEGRRLIQACLDGEISESSPRFQALLRQDPLLREEYAEFQRVEIQLRRLPPTADVSARVLANISLAGRSPAARFRRLLSARGLGLSAAACLLLVGAASWATRSAPHSPVGLAARFPAHRDLASDAREAIRSTTSSGAVRARSLFLNAPLSERTDFPNIDQILSPAFNDSASGSFSRQVWNSRQFQIDRAGVSIVNPGAAKPLLVAPAVDPLLAFEVTDSREAIAASRTSRSRFAVTGWYDADGMYVPAAAAPRANPHLNPK